MQLSIDLVKEILSKPEVVACVFDIGVTNFVWFPFKEEQLKNMEDIPELNGKKPFLAHLLHSSNGDCSNYFFEEDNKWVHVEYYNSTAYLNLKSRDSDLDIEYTDALIAPLTGIKLL